MKKIFTYLIAIAGLMVVSVAATAQNGSSPFIGSTHEYTVNAGDDVNNTLLWSVLEGSDGTEYDINSAVNTETLNITWNVSGTYTLQFTETADGTGCITTKQLTVIVQDNTFDVTISDSTITCNTADGIVNFSGTDTITPISFTVDTVGVDWDYAWEFKFTLSSGATLTDVAASAGDAISGSGTAIDPYIVTNIPGTTPSIDITLKVQGNAFAEQTVTMEIVSATELKYGTPALLNENILSTSSVNAIPNTSSISTD